MNDWPKRVEVGGKLWTQWERGGFWEADIGYVEGVRHPAQSCGHWVQRARDEWFAFPNIGGDARLGVRGPHPSRDDAMKATIAAHRAHHVNPFA